MRGGSLTPLFGSIFGTDNGAGMALMYVISSIGLFLVGISGCAVRILYEIEALPDYDNIA